MEVGVQGTKFSRIVWFSTKLGIPRTVEKQTTIFCMHLLAPHISDTYRQHR